MNGTPGSSSSNNGYENNNAIGHHQLPIELPLLQHHGNIINAGGHQNTFYPTPYYSSDPNTPSTASSGAAYSSLIHGYNPYSAITPQFELIFPGYPWHFAAAAVDIGGEVPLPSIDQQQTTTTAPLFSQTLSPLHNTAANNSIATAAAMTRYTRSSQNPRRGGRRPREEYEPPALNEEDRDKRDKRRQRNKEAAARCRQRRLDLMQTLQRDKDLLEQQNNHMELKYNTLKKGMEDIVESLRAHTCSFRDNNLMQQLESLTQTLRGPSYEISEQHHQHQNSHQQQHHEQQQQQMLPQSSNNNSNSTLLPPASLLSSSKRKVENISGQLQYPQQQQQQQVQQRFPRPNTLPLGGLNVKEDSLISPGSSSFGDDAMLFDSPGAKRNKFADDSPPERPTTLSLIHSWGQTPAIVTPSNGMPQISEFFKTNFPEEYNMLNQQTFLTPIAPNAISVSSATLLPPPRSDDLQDL